MSERIIENNRVTISGEIVSEFAFSHEAFGEKFYTAYLSTVRTSGTADVILVMVSDRLVDVTENWVGQSVRICGQFRSYNKHDVDKNRLILSVFAREFEAGEDCGETRHHDENAIFLDGYICKAPNYRETPLGRKIADLLIAVNRPYGKSDYIPCICWGRNARFAGSLEIGTHVYFEGRIQSREYQKRIIHSDTESETRTAYEVSVSKINVIEEMEG